MSTPTVPAGAPCWIDINTSDVEATRTFYTGLLGWVAEEASREFGGYFMFTRDGVPVAGGMPNPGTDAVTDQWSVYLSVPDIAAVVAATTAAGGSVIAPVTPIADLGSMAVVADPSGAPVAAWQAGTFAGLNVTGATGTPVWFELHTRAYPESLEFYRQVFGWQTSTMSDAADFKYSTLGEGDTARAGVMDDASHGTPGERSAWTVYFGVDDAAAAAAQVVALGASVTFGPQDTPYGRLVSAVDPTGVSFDLMQPPAA